MSGSESLGNELYTDSANLGRFTSKIGMYIFLFIGIIMVISGVFIAMQKPRYDPVTGAQTNTPRRTGLALVAFGILLALIGYFNNYMTRKSKLLAAGEGVSDVVNLFRR